MSLQASPPRYLPTGSSYPKDQLESLFETDSSDNSAQALHATLLMETNLRIPDATNLMDEIISRRGTFGRFVVCDRLGEGWSMKEVDKMFSICYTEGDYLCTMTGILDTHRGMTLDTSVNVYKVFRLVDNEYRELNVFCLDHPVRRGSSIH